MKKNKSLSEILIERKQRSSTEGYIDILHHIKGDILDEVTSLKDSCQDMLHYYNELKKYIVQTRKNALFDLFGTYSEAFIYILFKKKEIDIKRLQATNHSLPDFECNYNDKTFYVEVKNLNVEGGIDSVKELEQQSAKNNKEKKRNKDTKNVVISELEIRSFSSLCKGDIIEKTINKMNQNYKSSQFKNGITIPIYNLSLLNLYINDNELTPVFQKEKEIESSVLWNVFFGESGNFIYEEEDFEGAGNIGGRQAIDGFLKQRKNVAGSMCFSDNLEGEMHVYGFYNTQSNNDLVENIINIVSDRKYNTEKNSREFLYKTPQCNEIIVYIDTSSLVNSSVFLSNGIDKLIGLLDKNSDVIFLTNPILKKELVNKINKIETPCTEIKKLKPFIKKDIRENLKNDFKKNKQDSLQKIKKLLSYGKEIYHDFSYQNIIEGIVREYDKASPWGKGKPNEWKDYFVQLMLLEYLKENHEAKLIILSKDKGFYYLNSYNNIEVRATKLEEFIEYLQDKIDSKQESFEKYLINKINLELDDYIKAEIENLILEDSDRIGEEDIIIDITDIVVLDFSEKESISCQVEIEYSSHYRQYYFCPREGEQFAWESSYQNETLSLYVKLDEITDRIELLEVAF